MDTSTTLQDFISLVEAGMMAITVYLTVITGYLVAAYMAGPKLTRSQLVIVSLLFLLFASIFSIATYLLINAAMNLQFDDGQVGTGFLAWVPLLALVGELAGIVAALKFMVDIRRPSK